MPTNSSLLSPPHCAVLNLLQQAGADMLPTNSQLAVANAISTESGSGVGEVGGAPGPMHEVRRTREVEVQLGRSGAHLVLCMR